MRKRRVGVTARSQRIVGSQATGWPQVASEMAAPLELRTPKGTAAKAASSADGSMATMARESTGRSQFNDESTGGERTEIRRGGGARYARMRRCLMLRQGACPLRPRPPFPRKPFSRRPKICQGYASRAQTRRALDRFPPFRSSTEMRERGPMGTGATYRLWRVPMHAARA